jgi:hypothetical protein
MDNTYALEITGTTYDYRNAEEGDRIELAYNITTVIMDDDDLAAFDDQLIAPVAWAAYVIDTTTDAVEPSSSPIGDAVREHEWLSGSYTDPYLGDSKVTETSVRLTGDWTDEERALVFKMVTGKYHTA